MRVTAPHTTARLLAALLTGLSALATQSAHAAPAPINGDLASWNCVGQCGASAADGDITLSPLNNPAYGYVTTANSSATNVSSLNLSESGGHGSTFTQTNGSSITSAAFSAQASDTVDAYFNYVSTDGKGFDDYAWARLVNASDRSLVAWLFTARSTNSNKNSVVPGDLNVGFDTSVIVNYSSFDFNTRNTVAGGTPVNWSLLGSSNGSCWRDKAEGCGFTGWLHSQYTLASAGSYQLEVGVVNFGDQAYDSGLAFDVATLSAPVPEPGTLPLMAVALGVLVATQWQRGRKAD
jgi:PEP-CTERM motif